MNERRVHYPEVPDYRWEKIIRAVARGENLGFIESATWLLNHHPEYPVHQVAEVRHCAKVMEDRKLQDIAG